jgi:outer membrane protein assembly factor BamE (lipoprotein component of BamABCDE complex)
MRPQSVSRPFLALALGAGIALTGCSETPFFEDEYRRLRSVEVGMSEEEVTAALGEPLHAYSSSTAPNPYYVDGYTFKEREITNKVLIFVESEAIAYVYIDPKNEVEEIFVGGS